MMRTSMIDRARSGMQLGLVCLAHLTLRSAPSAQTSLFSVSSSDGRRVAELVPRAKAEPAPDRPGPCDLTVYDVSADGARSVRWRSACECSGGAQGRFLSADGAAFVDVDDHFGTDRPLVRVIRDGAESALDAQSLRVSPPAAGGGTWIALTPRACRLRDSGTQPRIDLLGRDGILRSIDLASGAVEVAPALEWARDSGASARIEPSAKRDSAPELAVPYVDSATVIDPYALEGDAVALEIAGRFPTPGFELAGFDITADAADPTRLTITPLAKPPSGIAAQVLSPFRATANLSALRVGASSIEVRGRDPTTPRTRTGVLVLPRNVFVLWDSGASGERRTIALLSDGRIVVLSESRSIPRVELAPVDLCAAIETKVRALPPEGEYADARLNAALVWMSRGELAVARRHAPDLERPVREIVDLLEALAKPGPTRYVIDPAASKIEVRTSSAGLFSVFGHDHTIATHAVSGFVDLAERDFAHAVLEVSIRADSLAIVDNASRKDGPEIEAEMRAHVLDVARHPDIVFRSTRTSAKSSRPLGPLTSDVALTGTLELCGVKREIPVNLRVGLDDGELEARGTFELRQTDFGIHPTSAAAGTVKVDDKLRIEFDIRARAPH
jgi:polyisoprenoid-binding protein YceI